jgi:hypothetical protein
MRTCKLGLTPVIKIASMVNPVAVIKKIQEFEGVWGEFIRDGPTDGFPGYVRDKYRERCDQFANLPPWAKALSRPVAGSFARACEPYWDDQGNDGPVSNLPFSGGQCEELYRINYAYNSIATSGVLIEPPKSLFVNVQGPIAGIEGGGLPAFQTISIIRGNGDRVQVRSGSCPQGCFANISILGIVKADGSADQCGDPPSELEPGPNPPTDPGPVVGPEPTDDPGNPFGPPLIPIPPYQDPVYGPIPIVGDPEPTDPGGGGNPSGGDGLPGAPDAIGAEAGGASGGGDGEDVDFGEPPEGKIWVGALVEAVVDSRLGNIPGTGPEQTVYPTVIGNASLIYTGGRGSNTRLESSSTLLTRQTTALVLTGCRVHATPGVDLTVKAISAVTCPDNPCEAQDG